MKLGKKAFFKAIFIAEIKISTYKLSLKEHLAD
jgi:hypothetical protein